MNGQIKQLAEQAGLLPREIGPVVETRHMKKKEQDLEKFARLIVEAVLDEVKERAYYTGDRDWSDEVDRQWIQLEFGYGKLHDAKRSGVK